MTSTLVTLDVMSFAGRNADYIRDQLVHTARNIRGDSNSARQDGQNSWYSHLVWRNYGLVIEKSILWY